MAFARTYRAIEQMIRGVALETDTARDIVRKAGLRSGGTGGGEGVAVLTFAVAQGERRDPVSYPAPSGFVASDVPVGVQNWFTWTPLQEVIEWWPDGYEYGFHTTNADLSSCTQIKNGWVIGPGYANPDINIRVMASLDGVSWDYPTAGADWRYKGANVNGGAWLTYNAGGEPYRNYSPLYSEHANKDDALPGGWTTSGWHTLKSEYRAESVYLRWTMEFSHDYDSDPLYTSFDFIAVGYGEIRAR